MNAAELDAPQAQPAAVAIEMLNSPPAAGREVAGAAPTVNVQVGATGAGVDVGVGDGVGAPGLFLLQPAAASATVSVKARTRQVVDKRRDFFIVAA